MHAINLIGDPTEYPEADPDAIGFPTMLLESGYSNVVSVGAPAPTPPAAPTKLTATLQNSPVVGLSWTDNALDETGFVIERSVNGGAFAELAAPGPHGGIGTAVYTDSAVTAGDTYAYRVKAVNAAGSSAWSDTAEVTIPAQATTFVTLAGRDRYATAVAVSKAAFPGGASTVIIATGANWPDALGGASLAGAKGAPILLTRPNQLSAAVSSEITRLGATEAIVLGSESAIHKTVFTELQQKLGAGNVSRIGGRDRYETAELIAKATKNALGGAYGGTCFLATGQNYPDALSASPLSAAKGWPVLLTRPSGVSPSTLATMEYLGVDKVLILGSTKVVSAGIEASLSAYSPYRISGGNRYSTAAAVATYGVNQAALSWDPIGIAPGDSFPDGLVGGVMQGKDGSVMLLSKSSSLSSEPAQVLTQNKASIDTVRFFGGTLSDTVKSDVAAALD